MNTEQKIPALRFPEFKEEWKRLPLHKMVFVNPSSNSLPEKFIYIDLDSVSQGRLLKENEVYASKAPSRAQRVLEKQDIIFQVVRPYQKNNYFFDQDGDYVASTGYAQLRTKENSPAYIYQFLHTEIFVKKVIVRCTGTSYPAINSSDLAKIPVNFPKKAEQEKIASFLWSVDEKIAQLSKKKELLEAYKKGVMQKIFKQEIRFKDDSGKPFPDWKVKPLNHYLYETKKRNYDMKFDKPDVLSVSGDMGIVNQIEHLGRSYAGEKVDNYHVVEVGDIVYTKSPLKSNPYGIIKVNKGKAGIVSTLYAVYGTKENAVGEYFDYYFELDDNTNRYLRPIVRKGAKNDMKVNNGDVLKDDICAPSKEEQKKIVSFLKALDKKIALVATELEGAQAFKKGLLQQMFV